MTSYDCTLSLLPFYKHRDVECEPSIEDDFLNTHKDNLLNNKHLLKILHLNCQSLAATFTEFEVMNYECNFDIRHSNNFDIQNMVNKEPKSFRLCGTIWI